MECINEPGSYSCKCEDGYKKENETCVGRYTTTTRTTLLECRPSRSDCLLWRFNQIFCKWLYLPKEKKNLKKIPGSRHRPRSREFGFYSYSKMVTLII